jgi:adenine-specific DNA-methyltransferase
MPVKYIPYVPNTVEGQAVLDNISRTQRVLRYRDNDKVISKILRGMPYYEVEKQEQVGEESENLVIRGECLSACAYLKEKGIKVDLVYIDPPFASGADYAKKVHIRRNPKLAEKIKKAEEELEIDELKAFEETMYGDIWQKEDYLNWMYENLITIKNIMSDEASIYVHLDQTIGHYVKILLDEVFGEHHFVNEVIWKYVKFQMGKMTRFAKNTDRIFLYSKSEERVFNSLREQLDEPKKLLKKGWDKEKGSIQNIKDENGKTQKIEVFDEKVDDLWNIPFIGATSGEREDYATQKPEKLLSRVIESCSNKEMLVADFFGGSGVTAKVANDLGRKFIHVDIGLNSIQTTRDRLVEAGASFQILEIKDGVSLFRNPQQTMDKLAKLIPGLQQKVSGVGKFWFGALQDSKLGTVPVYVPNLIDGSEKVLDIPAVNRIINEELQKLEIIAQKAIVYYVDVDDRKALEKFIKDNNATQTTIELKDLKEILHAIVVEDEVEIKTTKTEEGFEVEIIKLVSDRLNQKINDFNEKGNLQAINKGKKFSPITISEEGLELIEYLSLDCENAEGVWTSSSEIKIDKLGFISINGQKTKDFWNGKISADKKPLRLKIRNISGDETIKVFE